ncbi:unnamed protein product, partial [Mesorhabditis spiculigera]
MADDHGEPKNCLVTGGCGSIGSNFTNLSTTNGRLPTSVADGGRSKFIHARLNDQKTLNKVLSENNIDTVIHFAAITHVDDSYADRIGTIQENIISTTTLLESIVNSQYKGVKRLVHISTDEIYGDSSESDTTPKTETTLPNPTNPYAASKAACELIIQAYNPYSLMGDGKHCRSWMYVSDCSEAIRRVTESGKVGEVYNIGTEFEMTNIELTKKIHAIVNKLQNRDQNEPTFTPIPDRPYHDRRYFIDFGKIKNAFWMAMHNPIR